MKINHNLEYILCQNTCFGFLLKKKNVVTEHKAFGCDPLSLTACSCYHWLPGNMIKASLLCSLWLWSPICQKQGDMRNSECFLALAFFDSLTCCDRLQKQGFSVPSMTFELCHLPTEYPLSGDNLSD